MGETRPGGVFRGTDGKLHDAHGKPVKETVGGGNDKQDLSKMTVSRLKKLSDWELVLNKPSKKKDIIAAIEAVRKG